MFTHSNVGCAPLRNRQDAAVVNTVVTDLCSKSRCHCVEDRCHEGNRNARSFVGARDGAQFVSAGTHGLDVSSGLRSCVEHPIEAFADEVANRPCRLQRALTDSGGKASVNDGFLFADDSDASKQQVTRLVASREGIADPFGAPLSG